MTKLSRQHLRALALARKRPIAKKIGDFSETLRIQLLEFWEKNSDKNILEEMIGARLAKGLPLENSAYLRKEYSQVLLQNLKDGRDPTDPQNFNVSIDNGIIRESEHIAGPFCKARLSCLLPGGEIAEHIDDPNQQRIIAIVDGDHEFWVKASTVWQEIPMQQGELWFVNTAWPHKVINNYSQKRIALLINSVQPIL